MTIAKKHACWTMALACAAAVACAAAPSHAAEGDWPTYGHDKDGMRFSPLTQITPQNVQTLQPAWVYHLRPPEGQTGLDRDDAARRVAEGAPQAGRRFVNSQTTPLVIGGRMFITTPYSRVVALDPTTGKELWVYQVAGTGQPSTRGVEYWPGGKGAAPRIIFGTRDGRLIALDAATGTPAKDFGVEGVVNLKTPDVMRGNDGASLGLTSPPTVWKDLIITGSAVPESPALGPSGDVRAWDARTGKLAWTFHAIPREGEPGYGTWGGNSAENRTGVNVWGFITVDEKRGIAYLPFAAPSMDRFGGDRPGDNLFSSSLVAVDAATGKYLWHFQSVRHDIWDIDLQSAPILFDASYGGTTQPAVSIISKSGMLFVLNRVTGRPIMPIEYRKVPASRVPTEIAADTQPFPAVTPPLVRQTFDPATDVADVTPELKSWCENWIREIGLTAHTIYQPLAPDKPTAVFPGTEGGANWAGGTYDPKRQMFFVNTNDFGQVEFLVPSKGPVAYERGRPDARFMQPETRLLCQKPPWGRLSAVDMKTGKLAWQIPLGVTDTLPEDKRNTGRPGSGGAITTASGLLFVGATDDQRFRAFDSATGRELWTVKMEAGAHAVPVTYRGKDGRQYVAITATGGSYIGTPALSDTLTAFALPKR
jgi:quinoprotein glucose dehydrogenase